jgi:hypothetical protein
MEIGLEGVNLVCCESLGGVDGGDAAPSVIVAVDVVSDGLKEMILLVSEKVPPEGL